MFVLNLQVEEKEKGVQLWSDLKVKEVVFKLTLYYQFWSSIKCNEMGLNLEELYFLQPMAYYESFGHDILLTNLITGIWGCRESCL